ncbi:hypothetical protein FQN52_003560 [Onygenales sp. PD_12]|nr:hypothetical protein FQN52_003560 [Onygenales sp. PD_12]
MAGSKRPKGLLFDIGGVCVVSPFQAILDYEIANNIPLGWVNYSIQHTSPDGAWHKIERGEIDCDANFFRAFNSDFRHQHLWEAFHEQLRKKKGSTAAATNTPLPPLPTIDAEYMFWEMMRMARNPDPYMYPALQKLQASGEFVLGALSNTTILPEDSPASKGPQVDVKQYFDFFISSAHVGLRKPDPRIYELALKEMNEAARKKGMAAIEPGDIIFLDDIGINLKWAKKSGFRTIKVNLGRTDEAVRELEEATGLRLLENGGRARL